MKKAFVSEKINPSAQYQVIVTAIASIFLDKDVTISFELDDYLEARDHYKKAVIDSSAHLTHVDASRVISLYSRGKLIKQTYIETIEY